jgi:hypothetical protein
MVKYSQRRRKRIGGEHMVFKASKSPCEHSLLQKAARRGFKNIVDRTMIWLVNNGDTQWLRNRAIVIAFEECWPLASSLLNDRKLSNKQKTLLMVTQCGKQKDAASLGALADVYHNGDRTMLGCVPDEQLLKIVSDALDQPDAFFDWVITQTKNEQSRSIILAAQKYLSAAYWSWDKACILAGALLSTIDEIPEVRKVDPPRGRFPFWVAVDKHTHQGRGVLREISKQQDISYERLKWVSFYCEGAMVNNLLPSPWWEAEKKWRLCEMAGLTVEEAELLWSRVKVLVRNHLKSEAASLESLIKGVRSNPIVRPSIARERISIKQ